MRRAMFLLTACSLWVTHTCAENALPQIINLTATIDTVKKQVSITYHIKDAENSRFKIVPFLQTVRNENIAIEGHELTGDVGEVNGTGIKHITWRYNPAVAQPGKHKIGIWVDDYELINLQEVVAKVDSNNLKKDIAAMTVKRHYSNSGENLEVIRQRLETAFGNNHLQVERQPFELDTYKAANVVGQLNGLAGDKPVIVLGAHFDAVKNSYGSDDNASGVAGMLEVMRVLSQYQLNSTLAFVGFDQEEQGLLGSQHYIASHPDKTHIDFMINFDMIGYYDDKAGSQQFPADLEELFPVAYKKVSDNNFKGDFILSVGNEHSAELVKRFEQSGAENASGLSVVSLVVPDDGRFAPDYFRASDFVSFWDAGVKALSIGDTGNVRNVNYHKPTDIYATVNIAMVYNVVKATVATIAHLGGIRHVASQTCAIDIL
jgi:Peptidase family M28